MANAGFAPPEHLGWYLAAFTKELVSAVTPLVIGRKQLMIVTWPDRPPAVYGAICPHRGANLAYGGIPSGDHVICPFHGKAISLGLREDRRHCTQEYPSFVAGTTLFVCLDETKQDDRGFEGIVRALAATHRFVPCCSMRIGVAQEIVIENAFDLDHFSTVHGVARVHDLGFGLTEAGAAYCESAFLVRKPNWDQSTQAIMRTRFYARAFSPSLVLTELGPVDNNHVVITGATAEGDACQVRVVFALKPSPDGGELPAAVVSALLDGGREALQEDRVVWEHLDSGMTPRFDERDAPTRFYRDFCSSFVSRPSQPAVVGLDQ